MRTFVNFMSKFAGLALFAIGFAALADIVGMLSTGFIPPQYNGLDVLAALALAVGFMFPAVRYASMRPSFITAFFTERVHNLRQAIHA